MLLLLTTEVIFEMSHLHWSCKHKTIHIAALASYTHNFEIKEEFKTIVLHELVYDEIVQSQTCRFLGKPDKDPRIFSESVRREDIIRKVFSTPGG